MRALVGVIGVFAARVAAADVVEIASPGTSQVPLDALGWAVEASVTFDERDAHGTLEITDDRRTFHVDIARRQVSLEGETFPVDLTGTHAIRVEAAGGRRLLLVDGQVVMDHDYSLPDMVIDAPRGVAVGQLLREPVRWGRVTADTAPRGLAQSVSRYEPATHFSGPLASWLVAWSQRERPRRAELAAVVLPEAARMCAAFAIVAAVAPKPRPVHFRLADLKKASSPTMRPAIPEPQIEDFLETPPMAHRAPRHMMRSNYATIAQDELRKALAEKAPGGRLQRAVDAAITAPLPEDATDFLLAQLAVLAKRPDACR